MGFSGSHHFRKLDVWDRDWDALAKQMGIAVHNGDLKDPRTRLEKRVHQWLEATQPSNCSSAVTT